MCSNLVKEDDGIEIVAGIDKYTGVKNEYPVFTDIADCDVEADVVIDFSNALAVDGLLSYCGKTRWYLYYWIVWLDLHRYSVFLKRQQC